MSTKEALRKEIRDVPESVLDEVLDFVRFLRARLPAHAVPRSRRALPRKYSWEKTFAETAAAKEDWSDWDATLGDTHDA